ncbi:hypothetical protein KQX54_015739 [Cotesia glomerata]|uniref:Uncharacterized protein n=1 Tax=Cotesia glomerata TaxID=32391 RepID=A0AAV7I6D6_COTGL|nr:hypothetical protein KQX54_015739 [Cotesia glomerata]
MINLQDSYIPNQKIRQQLEISEMAQPSTSIKSTSNDTKLVNKQEINSKTAVKRKIHTANMRDLKNQKIDQAPIQLRNKFECHTDTTEDGKEDRETEIEEEMETTSATKTKVLSSSRRHNNYQFSVH